MGENCRIDEVRRRVEQDPASIAFSRVTLGRTVFESDDLDGAEAELAREVQNAPQNLAALRGLADISYRRGNLTDALGFCRSALALARHDFDREQTVNNIARSLAAGSPAPPELMQLERFLDAIRTYRHRSAV